MDVYTNIYINLKERYNGNKSTEGVLDMERKADNQQIIPKPMKSKPTLEELVSKITEENRHAEIDFGKPVGMKKCKRSIRRCT